ncbi:MAG: [FeFe] hydrogenase, group A [Spirochaetes bacterium]|nr:[FeFe] hydrogenase, group A [Spirochaetota bacterium]
MKNSANKDQYIIIDEKKVKIENERNLLELIRKVNIDIPTFCYHSDLSIYGACRLCIVEIAGRGILGACSTQPEPGMVVKTNTKELREIRKMTIELLLVSDGHNCPTCPKSGTCKLQDLAKRFGITEIRFHQTGKSYELDHSSQSLTRDPNKCILCGDCVRYCDEIQGVGAIDFAYRGADARVFPAFGEGIGTVECINCGQCARICPTGAITPKINVDQVWNDIYDEEKVVVAQIAPAVRVSIGEVFGTTSDQETTGKIVAALKSLGIDKVYDTSFTADLTIVEEVTEFINRKMSGEKLPQFTSCCPGWIKYTEQYYPDLLNNLSSCKSPQQMFGSIAKTYLPEILGVKRENLIVVSIMPCTAKKFEAKRAEFFQNSIADVDHVISTQELTQMINEAGINFKSIKPESFDMPLGFKTGAGIIFANSGGVMEAALRYASEKITGNQLENVDFYQVRGEEGIRSASYQLNDLEINVAVVHGLANAKKICEEVRRGDSQYDLIEVMSCPGGCIGGAGQPVTTNHEVFHKRTKNIYKLDKTMQLHKSQENPYIHSLYKDYLGTIGGDKAHELLHTKYSPRKRIRNDGISLINGQGEEKIRIKVCVCQDCFKRGAKELLTELINYIEQNKLTDYVDVRAVFSYEKCDDSPTVIIGQKMIPKCTLKQALDCIEVEKLEIKDLSAIAAG